MAILGEQRLPASVTSQWGIYRNATDASSHLCRLVDAVCGPDVGVVWAANGVVFAFRPPCWDENGFGDIAIFEYRPQLPRPKDVPKDFWSRTKAFIEDVMTKVGEAQLAQSEANLAMGRELGNVVKRMLTSHSADGVGVALDVLGVVLSVALLASGIGAIGVLALVGSGVLLAADGSIYALEMGDEEQAAEQLRHKTESLRIIATILTLPDIAWGGVKAIREIREVQELRALDRTTAASAESMAARTSSAARAARYATIADKAHLRCQIRSEALQGLLAHEIAPKLAGVGSTYLLAHDEFTSDHVLEDDYLRGLVIHCVGAHR